MITGCHRQCADTGCHRLASQASRLPESIFTSEAAMESLTILFRKTPQSGSMADTFIHSSGPNPRRTPPGLFCDCPQPGHLLTLDSDQALLNGITEQTPELFPGQDWRRHSPGQIPELSKSRTDDPWKTPIHFEEPGASIGKFCHLIPECLPVSATGIARKVERDSQPQPLSIPSCASPNGNRDHGVAPSAITAWLHPGDHLHRFAGTEDTD